ncbi:hypothetical protein Tco_0752158 [Tanacetum coccineum]|uniref:Uncharacterized protein n=1 Tax=Tanacetum coccineum TaxID=301880 RepID=A0ABQ4Z9C6_9ASTR
MNPITTQQVALDNALVALEKRLKIEKCNARIEFSKPQREETYQVTLDALKLSPCYPAFLIIAKICPRPPNQDFVEPPSEEEMVSFIQELGYTSASLESHKDLIGSGHQELKSCGVCTTRRMLTLLLYYGKTLCFKLTTKKEVSHDKYSHKPVEKPKQAKKPAKKSTTVPTAGVVLRDTPGVFVLKKKTSAKVDRGKGMDLLYDVALLEAAQLTKTLKKSKLETHKLHASGLDDGVSSQPKVLDEQQDKTTGINERTGTKPGVPDVPKDQSESENESWGNSKDDDSNDDDKEEYEEEYVCTPEFSDDEEEYEELYKDVNVLLKDAEHEEEGKEDAKMTDKTEVPLHSSSISSDFANQFLNLDNAPPVDNEVVSMMNFKVHHEEPSTQNLSLLTIPVTSTPTPTPAPTTETTTTSIPTLPDISSLFGFDQRVSILERDLSQLKQVDYSAQLLETIKSQIPAMKAQGEKKRYIDIVKKSVKDIIKDEVKSKLPRILPKEVSDYATLVIQSTITESLENVKSKSYRSAQEHRELYDGLVKSYKIDKDLFESYGKAYSLKRDRRDKDKDEDPPAGSDQGLKRKKTSKDAEPSKGSKSKESKSSSSKGTNKIAKAKKPPFTFDELMSTPIDFSAYVMNNLKIVNLTQEYLVGPAFNLLKGTCRSRVELEYHFEECYKAITNRLDWNNLEGQKYPFDLSKSLSLIEDRGRQVDPVNYFINNDLEYLKGGSSRRKYMTSTTKPRLLSMMIFKASNTWVSKHDVYSSKRIIAVTHLKVMTWYDYGYLEEIEVRREDHKLYKFKEGDFPRLNLRDIEDMLLLLVQKKMANLERDVIFDLNVALWMFTRRVVILKWV